MIFVLHCVIYVFNTFGIKKVLPVNKQKLHMNGQCYIINIQYMYIVGKYKFNLYRVLEAGRKASLRGDFLVCFAESAI